MSQSRAKRKSHLWLHQKYWIFYSRWLQNFVTHFTWIVFIPMRWNFILISSTLLPRLSCLTSRWANHSSNFFFMIDLQWHKIGLLKRCKIRSAAWPWLPYFSLWLARGGKTISMIIFIDSSILMKCLVNTERQKCRKFESV